MVDQIHDKRTYGVPGPKGDTPSVTVGSTTTANPNQPAKVTNSGKDDLNVVLDFQIPRGDHITDVTSTTINPNQQPGVHHTEDDKGDHAIQFNLPRASHVTGDIQSVTPSTTPVAKYDTDAAGDSKITLRVPRGERITGLAGQVVTPATGPGVTDVKNSDGDHAVTLKLPRAAHFTGDLKVVTPSTAAESTLTANSDGDYTLKLRIPRGEEIKAITSTTVPPTTPPSVTDTEDANGDHSVTLKLPRQRNITVGTTTTGAAGSSAEVSKTESDDGDVTLSFTIPTGAQGPKGDGMPDGGSAGAVLSRNSDNTTVWQKASDIFNMIAPINISEHSAYNSSEGTILASQNSLIIGGSYHTIEHNAETNSVVLIAPPDPTAPSSVTRYGRNSVCIGARARCTQISCVAIGPSTDANGISSVAIGDDSKIDGTNDYAVSLGGHTRANRSWSVYVGAEQNSSLGYETTRLIRQVSEPVGNKDAATKHYVDSQLAAAGVSIYVGSTEPTNWSVGDYWIRTDSNKNALDLNVRTS